MAVCVLNFESPLYHHLSRAYPPGKADNVSPLGFFVDYGLFIKRQLAQKAVHLKDFLMQIWSHYRSI